MIDERVLFVDAEAMVLDKPAGLAVHPGPRTPHSLEAMLGDLRLGFVRPPSPVHRLDRDTSGCLLLSRNPRAHKKLSALFESGAVSKTYWAVIDGEPLEEEGLIDLPLHKVSTKADGWRMVHDLKKGKAAQTRWRVLERGDRQTLIEFSPLTGRTHQIRVHAATGLGMPITGDPVYGRSHGAMMLHARRLVVPRGEGRAVIDVIAPLPPLFRNIGISVGMDEVAISGGMEDAG